MIGEPGDEEPTWRRWYPLLDTRRTSRALVRMPEGQGSDAGELTYALSLLKRMLSINKTGYALKRAAIPTKRLRLQLKTAAAQRRRRKAARV